MDYILAIDQSTAGTKGIVFTAAGELVARADLPHRQITNEKGWIEHDPEEILSNTLAVCRKAVEKAKIDPAAVRAVGISNQRETVVCWDRASGKPVYNAIVWQCGRAAPITDRMADRTEEVRRTTGLQLSPFFSAAKYAWILENVPQASELARSGRLCCGNIDSWLVFHLCAGHPFKTDYSNASRTQLLNLDALDWDPRMIELFGLKREMLAEICYSDSVFGTTTLGDLLPAAVPVCGVLGDSHAALFANGCHQPFTAKATFGTGTSVMMNAGDRRPRPRSNGVVESLAWGIGGKVSYVLEGNINFSGAITKWLVNDLQLIASSRESGELAQRVPDTGGVYLVPAFAGLGAPYWKSDARALLCGMTAATRKEHVVRASEEAIAYQIKDIVQEINNCCDAPLSALCVDGGATRDRFLMGFVSDILGIEIRISEVEELSAAGVAYLASISAGCCDSETIFGRVRHVTQTPEMDEETRSRLYGGWKHAVSILMNEKETV